MTRLEKLEVMGRIEDEYESDGGLAPICWRQSWLGESSATLCDASGQILGRYRHYLRDDGVLVVHAIPPPLPPPNLTMPLVRLACGWAQAGLPASVAGRWLR